MTKIFYIFTIYEFLLRIDYIYHQKAINNNLISYKPIKNTCTIQFQGYIDIFLNKYTYKI